MALFDFRNITDILYNNSAINRVIVEGCRVWDRMKTTSRVTSWSTPLGNMSRSTTWATSQNTYITTSWSYEYYDSEGCVQTAVASQTTGWATVWSITITTAWTSYRTTSITTSWSTTVLD